MRIGNNGCATDGSRYEYSVFYRAASTVTAGNVMRRPLRAQTYVIAESSCVSVSLPAASPRETT